MISIKNKHISCEISELGAEIKNLYKDGKNYFWTPIPDIWNFTAPLLFPICGGLKDGKYLYYGKEYKLKKHGYARTTDFSVERYNDSSVTLLHTYTEKTLNCYPFKYELRVIYSLTDNDVQVTYKVNNIDNKTMYFSIGSHEAFAAPEGIEDYDIIFPQKETLNAYLLDGDLLQKNTLPIIKNSNVLPLYDKYFTVDALVFKDLQSKSATLRNRKTGRFVKLDFPGTDYFLLWHKHGAPYICIEPWCGIQDVQETNYDITQKEGIVSLEQGEIFEITHTITVGEE